MLFIFIFFNRYFDKTRLKALILWNLTTYGEKVTIDLVEKLKDYGFHYATQAGLSLGIDDLKIPKTKEELILEAEITIQCSQKNYEIGNLTIVEQFQQLLDVWHRTSEILKQNVVQHFRSTDILNPVYMMAFSGARGNISQVRQLVGMRGLMADPQGQILDFPIRSNFREGLTLTEYIISCYGARKGLVDTALRTANSGYLTRRLVDVVQHIIVRQFDCGSNKGIHISDMRDGNKIIFSLQKRLIGRVLAEPIEDVAKKNQDISPSLSLKIIKVRNSVLVRSPLTCDTKNSICQLCYGWSLAHGCLVSLGEAVGILAAQSIGEPGTQLTMRTFHTGGVFSGDVMQEIRSPFDGIIEYYNPIPGILIRTLHGKIAFLTKTKSDFIVFNEIQSLKVNYSIPISTVLFIRKGEYAKEKQLVAEYSSIVTINNQGILANYNVNSKMEGQIYFEDVLLIVKNTKDGTISKTALKFGSLWILSGKLYQSVLRSNLFIKPSDFIDTGSLINESVFVTPYSGFLESYSNKKIKYNLFKKKFKSFFYQPKIKNNLSISSLKPKNSLIKKKISLNKNFSKLYFRKIQYKKFGYFISLLKLENEKIFISNSLKQKNFPINLKNLKLLGQKDTQLNYFFLVDKNLITKQEKKLFISSIYSYKNEKKHFYIINKFNSGQIIKKNKTINFLKNKQANKISFESPKHGFINSVLKKTIREIEYFSKALETYNHKFFKSPNLKEIKSKQLNKKFWKNSIFPSYSKINKKKIRKKTFKEQSFIQLKKNLSKFSQNQKFSKKISIRSEKKSFIYTTKEKMKDLNLTLYVGWNFLPKIKSHIFLSKNFLLSPTCKIIKYHFDQHYVSLENLYINKIIFFFLKTRLLNRIRYIKNSIFRYNKNHNFNIYFLLKKKSCKNNENFLRQFTTKEITFTKNFVKLVKFLNSDIVRNKIYKKNYTYKILFLLGFKTIIEIHKFSQLEEKNKYKKLIHKESDVKLFCLKISYYNKQKITKLKKQIPSIELTIQKLEKKDLEKNKNLLFQPKNIFFSLDKNSTIKKGNLKVEFDQCLNFLIKQNIESVPSLFTKNQNKKITKSKIFTTKYNKVFEENLLTLNSFVSPFFAEITTIKMNVIGQQKSLLLTPNDKISFFTNQKSLLVKLGQLVRYGDIVFLNTAITESGQIIQIDKNKITLRKAQPILFSSQGVFHIDNGDIIQKNSPILTLFYQKLKTEDIIQGIPKIEELFEARQTKELEILQENLHTKLNKFFKSSKHRNTSQAAARKSIEKIQKLLVQNVQKVYQSQGVTIADKHIEIIIRQMTTKVKITESGQTGLLRGELVDLEWVELINLGIEVNNKYLNRQMDVEKAEYEPIILGITKAALETESFISASSFQETTRILSRAAIERKTDFLRGLKENVILGNLIPAGTGFTLFFSSTKPLSIKIDKLSCLSYQDILFPFRKRRFVKY